MKSFSIFSSLLKLISKKAGKVLPDANTIGIRELYQKSNRRKIELE